MRARFFLFLSSTMIAVACSSADSDDATTTSDLSTNLPCEVDQIVKTRCQQCHDRELKAGAPMSLVTQADWQQTRGGVSIVELAKRRLNDSSKPMPPGLPMDPIEKAALEGWLEAGAPAGACGAGGATAAPQAVEPPPCEADTVLQGSEPYEVQQKDDQYVCFGLDVERTTKRHVYAMYPKVDNAAVLHHMLVFQADESIDSKPHPCESFGASGWKLMGGWAPGGGPIVLPSEAGYPENPGKTHWVLQMHYNNVTRKVAQKDRSGFGICTTEQLRQHDAGIIAFGAMSFSIPPRQTHSVSCDFTLDQRWNGVRFFGASPHMHKLGSAMTIDRFPVDGTPVQSVVNGQSFDFEEQTGLPISVNVQGGDRISTTCTWKNPTDQKVEFGEGTGAEMCFGFVTYYPAIPEQYTSVGNNRVPIFNWTTPSNNLPIMDKLREGYGFDIPKPTCHEN